MGNPGAELARPRTPLTPPGAPPAGKRPLPPLPDQRPLPPLPDQANKGMSQDAYFDLLARQAQVGVGGGAPPAPERVACPLC